MRGEAARSAARTHSLRSVGKGGKVSYPKISRGSAVYHRQLASRLTGGYMAGKSWVSGTYLEVRMNADPGSAFGKPPSREAGEISGSRRFKSSPRNHFKLEVRDLVDYTKYTLKDLCIMYVRFVCTAGDGYYRVMLHDAIIKKLSYKNVEKLNQILHNLDEYVGCIVGAEYDEDEIDRLGVRLYNIIRQNGGE